MKCYQISTVSLSLCLSLWHTHIHTHARTHTHARRTHARTHTDTHTLSPTLSLSRLHKFRVCNLQTDKQVTKYNFGWKNNTCPKLWVQNRVECTCNCIHILKNKRYWEKTSLHVQCKTNCKISTQTFRVLLKDNHCQSPDTCLPCAWEPNWSTVMFITVNSVTAKSNHCLQCSAPISADANVPEDVPLVEFMYVRCIYTHARWELP